MLRSLALAALSLVLVGFAQLGQPTPLIRQQEPRRPLEAVMLGSEALLADYYWFDLLQYFGGYRLGQHDLADFNARVERLMRLDPSFHRATLFAAVVRATDMEDPAGALRWLAWAERANPEEWVYPYEQGFFHYLWLENYQEAKAAFERAGRCPGAHPAWRHFAARIAELGGDPAVAREMWLQVAAAAEHPRVREAALENVRRLEAILLQRSQERLTAPTPSTS
jgi:hypothetical protein